ncbi:MAG: purine-binding chemotaxis protein CheW [bacterium]|nr:purine-binding chemotaxis protein CheW [bacterium]
MNHKGNQYLTFKLGNETYALGIGQVQEVLEISPITEVPDTPPFVRGVINVRGSVVPVVDMKLRFKNEKTEETKTTRIIVMTVTLKNKLTLLGALADSVKEVIELDNTDIEPPPSLGENTESRFITGMGKQGGEFIIMLNIEKVFSAEELTLSQTQPDNGEVKTE